MSWPRSREELIEAQRALSRETPAPWTPPARRAPSVGGCFVCFPRGVSGPGAGGERAWAAAALVRPGSTEVTSTVDGEAGAPYEAGLLALRAGPLLEAAVRALPRPPEVLLVNATGRDHPRRAGLALHLGAVLGIPTVGVTHRPLCARGEAPGEPRGSRAPLLLDGGVVGYWLRTRAGGRPLAVHAAWRTGAETAAAVALSASGAQRTPGPLRSARRAAREARARGV